MLRWDNINIKLKRGDYIGILLHKNTSNQKGCGYIEISYLVYLKYFNCWEVNFESITSKEFNSGTKKLS